MERPPSPCAEGWCGKEQQTKIPIYAFDDPSQTLEDLSLQTMPACVLHNAHLRHIGLKWARALGAEEWKEMHLDSLRNGVVSLHSALLDW